MLKWGTVEESMEGAERLNKLAAKLMGNKALYAIVMLAAFVLLSGAGSKFGG